MHKRLCYNRYWWASPIRNAVGVCLGLLAVTSPCSRSEAAGVYRPSNLKPPPIMREYRGAWVATVSNIDWPSTNRLPVAQQKSELLAILDQVSNLNLNTVIFQVRPACDAMYASRIEPWSEYLTGTMGAAPAPFWDPLAFAIDEAHKRGLELHAWFNPYRARHASAKSQVSRNHISKTRPELVKRYGGYLWLDPGEPEVQKYSLSVVMDVVKRYDVDGIHFDDYFYPYAVRDGKGDDLDFPDDASWERIGRKTGLSRHDWRRENVNVFIQKVYQSVKTSKPWVKFGVSPFGIWRPGHPPQIAGYDAYDKLYADSRKWLMNGWLDYFAPQLYWAIAPPQQSFPVLLNWWGEQNKKGRHLVPGINSANTRKTWASEEIVNQIQIARKQDVAGHIHWNMKSILRNGDLKSALFNRVYQSPAVPPPATWLDQKPPGKPLLKVSVDKNSIKLQWKHADAQPVSAWILQTYSSKKWSTEIVPGRETARRLEGRSPQVVALTALDRFGNASSPAVYAQSTQ